MGELDGGFGSMFSSEVSEELNLSKIRKFNLFTSPLFLNAPDVDWGFENLVDRDTCLCSRFKQLCSPVFPTGSLKSKYVFIAPQPDDEDGEFGHMYDESTKAGALVLSWLSIAGILKSEVYITSLAVCRGTELELSPKTLMACASLHKKEFQALENAQYIFTLGGTAFTFMSGIFGEYGSRIGGYVPITLNGKEANIIPLYNPNYALGSELAQEKVAQILKSIAKR